MMNTHFNSEVKSMVKGFAGLITVLILTIFSTSAQSKQGHKLDFQVKGLENKEILLAYYFNENTYTKDTVKADSNGAFTFGGEDVLPKGIYIVVEAKAKSKIFEFVVYHDQYFQIQTDATDPYRKMEITGDLDNRLFLNNMLFNASQNQKAGPFNEILKSQTATQEEKNSARAELIKLNKEVMDFQDSILNNYGNTLMAKIMSARKDVDVPEFNKEKGIDTTYQYYYYKDHFWDKIDVADDALLRLPFPLLSEKINQFYNNVIVQNPDTVIKEIDKLISKAKSNQEMYRFFTWNFVTKYYSPDIMGLDKVFVHLSDTYFKSGEMDFWVDSQLKKTVTDRASQLRLSLLGMTAPNLIMQDASSKSQSLYEIKSKYTVVYFYDPDCGHCKQETPVLVDFNKNTTFDVQVYAVCADTSMAKMTKYIAEMGMQDFVNVNGPRSYVGSYQDLYDAFQTPTVYVLDDRKKIIAKKLPSEKLEDFLIRHEKVQTNK